MSVTEYKNCKYHIPKLKPIIYLLDSTKVENRIHIDGENAIIDEIENGDVLKIYGLNTELTENASIDERYRFEKEITFTTDGYYSLSNIYNKYYIVVEDYHGNQWVCNVDLPSKPTYNYMLDDSNNNTTYTFNILSNFPLIRLRNNISGEEVKHCRYFIGGIKKLQLLEHGKAILNNETREVAIVGNNTWKDIEPFLKSFQESFDGDNFSSTITFTIPLDEYKSHFQYSLLEFNENRYVSIITPLLGSNVVYAGFDEFGLIPTYSIATDNTNIVTISLNGSSKCVFTEEYDSYQDGTLRWIPISSVTTDRGEYMTSFECSSVDGYAKYLLITEVDAFGRLTNRYKVLEGYEEDYEKFINIIGTFDDEVLFKHDDCKFKCQTISNIPNVIVFTSVASYTYTISSLCTWTIDNSNLPSGVTVSPLSGGTGITNITISCTDVGASEGNYSIVLHTQDEDIPSTISVRLSKDEEYYAEIDARRQNVDFNTIFPIEYLYGDITKVIDFNVIENYIKFDIPRNDSTEERIFNIVAEDIYGSEITFHILQYGIVQEWIEEDDEYVCVGGDLYSVATLWTGYTQSELKRTNETKPYTMSVPRSEECEQYSMWQWNGDTICIDGNLYQLLTLMVSSDGYEWRETEETMAGDLIEESSLDCAENIYEINVRTKDEVGSSIWTTIVVRINGGEPMNYVNVSACTFNVAEGAEYEILFADKPNYFKPDTITATATEDKTYDAIYTTARQYNVGVTTVDEQRNYIRSNITICMDGQCRTYQSVSAITFSAPINTEFEVSFSDVQGYSTPQPIETSITADVDYIAVYGTPKADYDISVSSNMSCDITINGTTYQNVIATSVTLASGTSYVISFNSIEGYTKPNNITGVATTDMSYQVEYTEIINTYTISVATTDENSNPIFTRIGVSINGHVQTYPNVSGLTFNVNEGDDYIITYFAKEGYIAPSVVSVDSATSDASYIGIYQKKDEKFQITINPNIECDITVTINGTSTQYEDVKPLYIYLDSGDTYVIEFEDKVGYIKPNTISGIANGNKIYNVKYTRIYTLRVISNMPCDMTINGTTYSSVTDTSVTIVSGASYSVSFGSIEGYITPSTQSGIMDSDKTITVNYEAKTYYDLVVNSNISCTMTINGNSYTNTSVTLSLESGSSYEISFSNEIGYTKPNNISGVLNDNTTYNVEYEELTECTMLISSNMVTDVVVVINGSSTTYNDITTTSLTLTQGDTYSVSFEQKEDYKPIPTSSGIITSDITVYAIYQESDDYTNITAIDGDAVLGIWSAHSMTIDLKYSFDKQTWIQWDYSDITIPSGSTIYMKGYNPSGFTEIERSGSMIYKRPTQFKTKSGKIAFGGSIQSILWEDNYETNLTIPTESCFQSLFGACSGLTTAPTLPATSLTKSCYEAMFASCTSLTQAPQVLATTLAQYCYTRMFQNCTSLTQAPSLPSVTLEDWCYEYMFQGCTSLVNAPTLSATTLPVGCYGDMFSGCTSLTTAPQLPATTLNAYCYVGMFKGCTSLTQAPTLPAETLVEGCYADMFANCSSLNYINMQAININAYRSLDYWVENVASNGTFVKNPNAQWYIVGDNGVPSGWTSSMPSGIILATYTTNDGISGRVYGQNAIDSVAPFYYGISDLTITNNCTSIGDFVFDGFIYLSSVTIGNNVTSIGERAFGYCSNLSSITIPSSVTSIGDFVFEGCENLNSITSLATTAPTITEYTFNGLYDDGTLHVPRGANYDTWMSPYMYYLGFYNWTKVEQ